jgi:hypothetical protein
MIRVIKLLLISLLIFSCKPSYDYTMNIQSHIRSIEREDHQACISQGIDFGKWNEVITELYWRCRYNLIQDKKIHDATTTSDIKNNAMVKKISIKILKNLKRARQAILADVKNDIEVFDHSKCLARGYNLDNNNPYKNEEYYECRKQLIYFRTSPTPKVTNSYEASTLPQQKFEQYIQNSRRDKVVTNEINFANNMIDNYPACNKINVRSKFFGMCIKAQKESVSCLENMNNTRARKQLDNQIYCQQQSFIQFPDNYSMARNMSQKEVKKMMREQREEQIKRLKEEKEAKVNRTLKFFEEGHVSQDVLFRDHDASNISNDQKKKEELYEKIQILELREEFIMKCNELMHKKLPDYIEDKTKQCLAIGENWSENLKDL